MQSYNPQVDLEKFRNLVEKTKKRHFQYLILSQRWLRSEATRALEAEKSERRKKQLDGKRPPIFGLFHHRLPRRQHRSLQLHQPITINSTTITTETPESVDFATGSPKGSIPSASFPQHPPPHPPLLFPNSTAVGVPSPEGTEERGTQFLPPTEEPKEDGEKERGKIGISEERGM